MMDVKENLLQWFINFFDKKSSSGTVKNKILSKQELGEKLHETIIIKSE